jgi:hypothetical protein
MLHMHREPMQVAAPLVDSGARFGRSRANSFVYAEPDTFIKPQRGSNVVVLTSYDEPAASAKATCPEKAPPQDDRHEEPAAVGDADPFPLSLRNAAATFFANEHVPVRRNSAQAEQSSANMVLLTAGACPEKEPGPLHLERRDGGPTPSGNDVPPPSPHVIQQVMASYPDLAAYETPQTMLRSALHS